MVSLWFVIVLQQSELQMMTLKHNFLQLSNSPTQLYQSRKAYCKVELLVMVNVRLSLNFTFFMESIS